MAQKVIITNNEDRINKCLVNGWSIKMIVTQHHTGKFCFLLEKNGWDE
jgi:hypothetical protein